VIRAAALIVGVVLAAGVLWLAGEQHRKNCIADGRVSCSVVPWDAGEVEEAPKLTQRGCALLRREALLSEYEVEIPPECRR
jgi:hypothetical protein